MGVGFTGAERLENEPVPLPENLDVSESNPSTSRPPAFIAALLARGSRLAARSRLHEARVVYSQAARLDPGHLAANELACYLAGTDELGEAAGGFRTLLNTAQSARNDGLEAVARHNLAVVHRLAGQHAEARALQQRALAAELRQGESVSAEGPEAADFISLAIDAIHEGELERAVLLLQRAFQAADEDAEEYAAALGNLGVLCLLAGDWLIAAALLRRAYHRHAAREDWRGAAADLSNLAEVYRRAGKPRQSLTLLHRAWTRCQQAGAPRLAARVRRQIQQAHDHFHVARRNPMSN